VLSFVVLVLLQMRGFADDPGVGWHLKTGEWIVGHKSVPTTDPFLFSSEPREWKADQWLSDVFTFAMYERGSWVVLYAVFTAIFLFTFWGPLYTFVIRRKVSCLAAFVSIFLAQKLASIHFILRPVLFSFLLFSGVLVLLVRAYEGACKSESRSSGLVLACGALFVLWANVHPSFFLGLVMVAAAAITYPFECIRSGERIGPSRFFGMVGILGVSGLGTLINPYGIGIYQTHLDHALYGGATGEWLPLALTSLEGNIFLGLLCVIGGGILVSRSMREKISVFEAALLLFFAGLTLIRVRFLPYFAIVACVPVALALTEVSSLLVAKAQASLSRRLIAIGGRVESICKRREAGEFWVFVSAAALIAWGFFSQSIPLYDTLAQGAYGPSGVRQPIEMIQYLAKNVQSVEPVGVLTDPNWGGAVTWYGGGRLKPVLDDRENLNQSSDRFFTVLRSGDDRVFKKYAQDVSALYALIRSDSPLGAKLAESGDFEVVERDSVAILARVRY
jgi:hypothetical protein